MNKTDIKFKKFEKKRTIESQVMDLINDLKAIGIKIIENSKYQNGYGEGVCLILTQLLDKYLINQNFIFKKPLLNHGNDKLEDQNNFEEVILEENNINYLNGKNGHSTYTNQIKKISNNNFYNSGNQKNRNTSTAYSARKRFHSGKSNVTQGKIFKIFEFYFLWLNLNYPIILLIILNLQKHRQKQLLVQ